MRESLEKVVRMRLGYPSLPTPQTIESGLEMSYRRAYEGRVGSNYATAE
jgi:hypothetical protein